MLEVYCDENGNRDFMHHEDVHNDAEHLAAIQDAYAELLRVCEVAEQDSFASKKLKAIAYEFANGVYDTHKDSSFDGMHANAVLCLENDNAPRMAGFAYAQDKQIKIAK